MSGKNVDNFLDTMVYGEVGDWTHSTPNGYERNVEIKLGWGDRESTPGLFATHLSSLLSDHALPLNFPPWTSWPSSSPSNHRHFTQAGPPTCLNNSPFENLVDLSSISTSCKKPCLVKSFCYNLLSHQAAFLQRTFQNSVLYVSTWLLAFDSFHCQSNGSIGDWDRHTLKVLTIRSLAEQKNEWVNEWMNWIKQRREQWWLRAS